ncbi:hypothetical protein OAY51_02535 [Candidatus Pelagibacter sp.]|nr:hypothetical protein [Candidatus Pelagibacter sp.]
MNIYLHVEVSIRELDSKILLAVLAASKGHQVIISDLNTLKKGLFNGLLSPGIFHTKSLTPNDEKMGIHQALVNNGFKITSIDEEGGLLEQGYSGFAKIRYSEQSIKQASAIFGWGDEDTDSLKKIYSKHSDKIYKTGSPRVDLWRSNFSKYWNSQQMNLSKPFLLVSSNLYLANFQKPFFEWGGFKSIKFKKGKNFFQTDPMLFKKQFFNVAEDYHKLVSFIEAINHLANLNRGFDIVLRPHPLENVEAWKKYLYGIPNVHVIREGSINSWVNNAFAVMHNSCTTALEATVSKKPLVTYIPFKQEHAWEIPNKLGYQVYSLEDLSATVNRLFDESKSVENKDYDDKLPKILSEKLYIDNDELAAEKMIKIWESINTNFVSSNLIKFQWYLKIMNLQNLLRKAPSYPKFPALNKKNISEKINSLKSILGINQNFECKILSDRTILIKKV